MARLKKSLDDLEALESRYTKEQLARAVLYLATEHYSLKKLNLSDLDKIITVFPFQREAIEG